MSAAQLSAAQTTAAGVLNGAAPELETEMLAAIVPGGTLDAAGALDVYRRGYIARLTEQLGETYASVWRVLGDDGFFDLCRAYIAAHPSSSYNLSDYGRDFAAYIELAPSRPSLPPFLAELARLELAMHDLFHAHAHVPLDAASLASIGDLAGVRFRFGSAVRLIACEYAVYEVYRHRNDEEEPDLDVNRAQYMLLFRDGSDVRAREVGAAAFAGLEALANGAAVEEAIDAALARDPAFGPAEAAELFGVVVSCGLAQSFER
jgi:hypothetical protein